jgi:hypothetical protein
MKKTAKKRKATDELRQEYNLSNLKGGVRGKYFERYQAGTNLVLLSPDVARHFPNEQSVNSALRTLIRAGKRPLPQQPGHRIATKSGLKSKILTGTNRTL